jgi:hypothetical protein
METKPSETWVKPNGEEDIWSYIVIRNAKDGNNTEVAAGTTAKSFIMDEVGKYPFLLRLKLQNLHSKE